jgi:hypothetical protein
MGIAGGTDTPAPFVVIANMVLNLWSRLNILLEPMPKRLWPIFQILRMFSHKFKLVSFYK